MLTMIESINDIDDALPYSDLIKHRFQLASTTQVSVITSVEDYLLLYGRNCPFDGFIYDGEYQVFIGVAVISNSGVREIIIPSWLVSSEEFSFLKEFIDE